MKSLRLTGFLLLLFVFPPKVFCTHIVGGEITYECLGNDQYEITLTVYRDCYNGQIAFDNLAIVGIYGTGLDSIFLQLNLPYDDSTNDTLPVVLNNPCLVVPPGVCVHKATYSSTVVLPYRQKGYTIVYQRCCRNRLIRNMVDPLNTGITFAANISGRAMMACNNAATFNNWPPVAVCVHEPIDFDHSAFDVDGDLLRYRLCTPLDGPDSLHSTPNPPPGPPYPELNWIDPPYNLSNMLGGVPLTIDPVTGFMTGIPNTLGNFVVGVCVDEFRNDTLISTTRRDFQYNVADCGMPRAAFFMPAVVCDTFQVHFENQSQFTQAFQWYFDWPGDLSQASVESSPVYTYPDTGAYTVVLIAEPNSVCSDTFLFELQLVETAGTLVVSADPAEIERSASSQLTANFPGAVAYTWVPTVNISNADIFNPVASPLVTTAYTVEAILPNGCKKSGSVTIAVIPPACDDPFVFFPTGFSPNDDGENDVLKMESNIVGEAYWVVFNRWGEKVFEAFSLDDAWDGRFQGQPQPAETYGYYYKVRCTDGQESIKKGNVTLLR